MIPGDGLGVPLKNDGLGVRGAAVGATASTGLMVSSGLGAAVAAKGVRVNSRRRVGEGVARATGEGVERAV